MAKAVSFINQPSESSEYDYFLELLKRLGDPLNKISSEIVNSLSIEQRNALLSSNMTEYSAEFIQFLFDNVITHLIKWESFNVTGKLKNASDTNFQELLEISECYEEDSFDDEFNEVLNYLKKQFLSKL